MDTVTAQEFVQQERARWLPGAFGCSDVELLQLRERLFNGLTMAFALACPVAYLFGNYLFESFLNYGAWGGILSLLALVSLARQCSVHADYCKDVRVFLQGASPTSNASQQ
jgi:hypothetical protein